MNYHVPTTGEDLGAEPSSHPGDFQAIIDHAHEQGVYEPPAEVTNDVITAVTPVGHVRELIDLDEYNERPRRRVTSIGALRTDSLVDYLARWAIEDRDISVSDRTIYVNPAAPSMVAVLDDDAWREHRVTVTWPTTPEWEAWNRIDRDLMGQVDFAEFVEDWLHTISSPPAADLLELAQSMKAHSEAAFRSDRRLASGQTQVEYVEQVEARGGQDGTMTVPNKIELYLAPFLGAEPQPVTARLRYRIGGGKLSLGVILDRPHEVINDAIESEISKVTGAHPDVLVVWGTP